MNLLTAENLSKSFNTDKILFDNISLGINEGDKIGLIGINGTGKSTLLKILAGEEEADSGKLTKGNSVRIAYLPQNPEFDEDESVISEVIKGKKAKNEFWDIEGEARSLLVKFEIEDVEAKVATLSGGQKKRAALVRTLLDDADILILDEPTNHLDTAMSEWLEDYLKKMKQALLIITHDRYFLDQVTNRIVELTHGKLYSYVGGYMKYLELKAEREEMEIATERKNAALFKKDLAWMMRGARARSTKQKAHIERFEELKNRDKIVVDKEIVVDSVSSRLGKQIIEIENISKAYGDKALFTDFTYLFRRIDRIGIIGKNGSGKSTLLKTILGEVKPDSGNIIIGQTAKIGYFSQDSGELDPSQTVIESAKDIAEYVQTRDGTISASKMLERFLFEGAMQYTKIEKLSGGERRRLALLHTLISAPNILILDEPTNDLDITTLSILEDYLDADFIIVDEFSMVDTWLANQLLSNIATDTKLLIVGDADQLPSVSPGQVLADLLQIPSIPQTKLEHIFRQSEDSTIVSLAGDIRQGKLPQDFTERKADRSYFEAGSEHIPKMIEQITSAALRSQIPARDIQVLAPMYKGQAGIDNINTLMQDLLNPAVKDQVVFDTPDCQYRDGDKVIHLVNDAESNVFNGDIGYITDLLPGKYTESKQDELTIQFDGNEIVYPRNEWYKIRLAYAMSIHKSQGSEFPVVILPITNQSHRMLQRNLIYTAITRSKSKLILLGEYSAFDFATKNTGTARKTYLVERFKELDGGEATTDYSSSLATASATVESARSKEETVETKAETSKPTVYRLTEDNLHTISPMIGLTEEEIAAFFDIKKDD